MITTPRIRLAKKPGDETPGAVPPEPNDEGTAAAETPVGQAPASETPASQTPAPEAPAAAAPAAPASAAPAAAAAPKSRKGLFIGLIAGGAALVVIAIVAVIALVLPGLLGGSSDNAPDVADIASEPEDTWKFDWVGDADQEFLESTPSIAAVGDNQALVWATFDYYAYQDTQGNSDGWYEGYDEQYADGYAAGLEYEAAVDAYFESTDFSLDYPNTEDFYPEGAYGNYDEWLGFDDGFWDARLGEDEGASKKEKPVDPDYSPSITLISTNDGDEVWTVDLSEAIDGVDYSSNFYAFDVTGSNAVAVVASSTGGEEPVYSLVTLAKSDGEVISELESDGPISADAFGGDLIVTTSDLEDESTTVARYAVGELDDDAKWEEDGPDSSYGAQVSALGSGFVQVSGEDEGFVLDAATGKEADFGDDVESSVGYLYAGSQLLRIEDTDDSTEVEGWNADDKSTWKDSVEADYVRVVDGYIFTAESDGDQYTDLMAIRISDGEELWEDTLGEEFDQVYAVRNGVAIVVSDNKLLMIDVNNGEEKFSQKLGDVSGFWEGSSAYYVYTGDELAAYSYSEKGDIWSYDVDDDQSIVRIGKTLGLLDRDKGTLHGLGAK